MCIIISFVVKRTTNVTLKSKLQSLSVQRIDIRLNFRGRSATSRFRIYLIQFLEYPMRTIFMYLPFNTKVVNT